MPMREALHALSTPLAVEQILDLLESAVAAPNALPAALLCRAEALLLASTAATRVDAFLVSQWFKKLFHYSPAKDDGGGGGGNVGAGVSDDDRAQKQSPPPPPSWDEFETRAVCEIGEGLAGKAALTGRTVVVRDCSRQSLCGQSTGSIVCLPVLDRRVTSAAGRGSGGCGPAWEGEPIVLAHDAGVGDELTSTSTVVETEGTDIGATEGVLPNDVDVLAVLQVYCADGEMRPAEMALLRDVGRLLVPLLRGAMAKREEQVQRCTAEALYSLSQIAPRDVGLVAMIEEVVLAAEHLAGSERVCLFFVDDSTNELWVAKSQDFDDANIKLGQGLCGYAAATGEAVNVINSYDDSRFDSSWDKQTGFVTKSVLCVPIPPPDHVPYSYYCGGRRTRWNGDSRGSDSGCRRDVDVDNHNTRHSSLELPKGGLHLGTARSNGGPAGDFEGRRRQRSGSGSSGWSVFPRSSRSTRQPRPMAVLELINKRGGGVFDEHEEIALLRLCGAVECLLRRKAAEVMLMKSGMTLRSCFKNGRGGDTASSNSARVESTILRLYSETHPSDVMFGDRDRARGGKHVDSMVGGGDAGGRDAAAAVGEGADRSKSYWDPVGERLRRTSSGGEERSWSTKAADGAVARLQDTSRLLGAADSEDNSELVDWSLNMFERTAEQQLSMVERFFRSMGLAERFQITSKKMRSFLLGVEKRYHPNPFHNLTHATSVTQAAFTIVSTTSINALLRPLDKLALLTAAICHDIDHPGNNNDYEVNSLSPLALQHGDSSVLERHHVFVTFQVLLQDDGANNILSELSRGEFREVRQIIVQAILATDMSRHMQHCAEISQFACKAKSLRGGRSGEGDGAGGSGRDAVAAAGGRGVRVQPSRHAAPGSSSYRVHAAKRSKTGERMPPPPAGGQKIGGRREAAACDADPDDHGGRVAVAELLFSKDKAEHRSFLTRTILHCADLSGQVLETDLALQWGQRILEEFRTQADMEAKAGLSLTTIASGDQETTMKGQHFFLSRIVKPLWEPFVTIFPKLEPLLTNLNGNCEYYQREALACEKKRLSSANAAGSLEAKESADSGPGVAPVVGAIGKGKDKEGSTREGKKACPR